MTNDNEPLEDLTATTERTSEWIANQTQQAMENYFGWLQKTMSSHPWGSTALSKKLLSYATENVTATLRFVQKLSQAKDLQDVVEIQTEFVQIQIETLKRAKELGDAVAAMTKARF